MLNLRDLIERFFQTGWKNTNDKEQNLQGRLYAYLLPLQSRGYTVEMETSTVDEHLKKFWDEKGVSEDDIKDLPKKEIDLLIYNDIMSEVYAAELKWIYERKGRWNILDNLDGFTKDAKFCKQLHEIAGFTGTCSVVVQNFEESKQVKRSYWRETENNKGYVDRKRHFLGCYSYHKDPSDLRKLKGGSILVDDTHYVPFVWKDLYQVKGVAPRDYRYYIVDSQDMDLQTCLDMPHEPIVTVAYDDSSKYLPVKYPETMVYCDVRSIKSIEEWHELVESAKGKMLCVDYASQLDENSAVHMKIYKDYFDLVENGHIILVQHEGQKHFDDLLNRFRREATVIL